MKMWKPFAAIYWGFRDLVSQSTRHPVGLIGVNVVIFSILFFTFLTAIELLGFETNPYLGILAYLVLPVVFTVGVILVPVGAVRARRLAARRGHPLFPILDLNRPEHRQRLTAILILSGLNLLVLAVSGFQAVHYMDSSKFCGLVCHKVMVPEYTAYLNSPHARVGCVDCHIGPGAGWFVRSKLSGLRQVAAVALDTYHRPLPNPVRNLRPARETCEQCHWPEKFHGDRIKVKKSFGTDRENSEVSTVLLLKVGGGSAESGFAEGIHWHMNLKNRVEYIADSTRTQIYWVGTEDQKGNKTEYQLQGIDFDPKARPDLERRVMDCLDCHNRPTHEFSMPEREVDLALQAEVIPRSLPFVRREAVRLLRAEYGDREAACREIEAGLRSFYRDVEPVEDQEAVGRAAEALTAIYRRNVFPEMKVGWGTYVNHIGHEDSPGCFRCHDDSHVSPEGKTISQDCTNCHHILAVEEAAPEILGRLYEE
jgi:hypothetical protein